MTRSAGRLMLQRAPCLWCIIAFVLGAEYLLVNASSTSAASTSSSFWRRPSSSSPPWFSFRRTNDHETNRNNVRHLSGNKTTTKKSLQQQRDIPAWKASLPEPLCSRSTLERILVPFSLSSTSVEEDGESTSYVQVYLLGTAHVSKDSCQDVRILLEHVHPDVLFLELCEQRMGMVLATARNPTLSNPTTTKTKSNPSQASLGHEDDSHSLQQTIQHSQRNPPSSNLTFWTKVGLLEQDPKQHMSRPAAMATVLLTQVQEEYANSLGVELGGEFRVAYQYYLARLEQQRLLAPQHEHHLQQQFQRSIHVVLGDRPLFLTLRRGWESLNWWGRTRLLLGLAWSSLWPANPEEIKKWMQSILESGDTDILTKNIAELNQTFPTLTITILDERNAYMACKLYQTCRSMIGRARYLAFRQRQDEPTQPNALEPDSNLQTLAMGKRRPSPNRNITIVAIVGAGHVQGMVEWFTNGNGQEPEQVLRELVRTKSRRRTNNQPWWRRMGSSQGDKKQLHDDANDDSLTAEQQTLIEHVIELQQA